MAWWTSPVRKILLSLLVLQGLAAPSQAAEAACPTSLGRRAARLVPAADTAQTSAAPLRLPLPAAGDYRHLLRPTPLGWARLAHWCVWVEPVTVSGPAAMWDQRWLTAIEQALLQWQELLPITRVGDPGAAQVLVFRRRPPLAREASGRTRASHGRALLELVEVDRGNGWRLEPRVEVLISPGQRQEATEATALHELGHAFGLWGHSDDAGDAMAAVPGARPVLLLSPRDRATLQWLYRQPTRFGQSPAAGPATERRVPVNTQRAPEAVPATP
ncbi:MAG: hypothetical protein ER33_08440 [Cyanobium sp. CACIAM 14]|nr:MAG: hypothetical protein ER33_08440 [Cyanobium sp. CACIAM 14]